MFADNCWKFPLSPSVLIKAVGCLVTLVYNLKERTDKWRAIKPYSSGVAKGISRYLEGDWIAGTLSGLFTL